MNLASCLLTRLTYPDSRRVVEAIRRLVVSDWVRLVGPHEALEIGGVKLVGATAENAKKLLFSVLLILVLLLLNWGFRRLARLLQGSQHQKRSFFWTRQVIRLFVAVVIILGLVSIWFDNPTRLATFLGLMSAGLAFALQKVITALAGYFVILRGRTFNVGDRITMGGVRGDVIALGFFQTTIMEMGQPPAAQNADATWVQARQYTGRIVTVTNAKIFDEPVYNYTREFPYIWEEMHLPIAFGTDRQRAEQILLEVVQRHTVKISTMSEAVLHEMERRYVMKRLESGAQGLLSADRQLG